MCVISDKSDVLGLGVIIGLFNAYRIISIKKKKNIPK